MNTYDIRIPYVEVRDKDRNLIVDNNEGITGIIEGAEIFFEYALHGCGEFEIYCRATKNNLALLKEGNYITLPENAGYKGNQIEKHSNMWIIEKIERSNIRTGGRWITATGREAKQIVDRRIIYNATILNGDVRLVDEVKTKLFDKNLTIDDDKNPRKIQGFIFNINNEKDENGDYKDPVMKVNINKETQTQVSYENLFDYTEEFYLNYGVAAKLRLNRETKEMLYTIYKGEDKSNDIVFSTGHENILSTNYVSDWSEYKTFALIGGEEKEFNETDPETGEVTRSWKERQFTLIDDNNTDINRREVFVDARDIQSEYEEKTTNDQGIEITNTISVTEQDYIYMLKERGYEKLVSENNKKVEFTGEIDITNDNYKFNIDYYLGDEVLIRDDDFGDTRKVRVSKFVKVQNDEGYKEYFEYEVYKEVE